MVTKAELLQKLGRKITKKELQEIMEDFHLSRMADEAKKEKHKGKYYEELRKEIFG